MISGLSSALWLRPPLSWICFSSIKSGCKYGILAILSTAARARDSIAVFPQHARGAKAALYACAARKRGAHVQLRPDGLRSATYRKSLDVCFYGYFAQDARI